MGFPLVVLLNEGFPEVGSPQEKYYKPGGTYFEACSNGKLRYNGQKLGCFGDDSL